MQAARTLSRHTLGIALHAARIPLELTTRLLPGGEGGLRDQVGLLTDRADAAIRQGLGALTRDVELEADGRKRALAAAERKHASDLRATAAAKRMEADHSAAVSFDRAEQRRVEAQQRAEAKQDEAAELRAERVAAQHRAAERRKDAALEEAAAAERKAAREAKRARVDALGDEIEALDTKDEALATTDEARRLTEAANAAKAFRKQR